MRTRLSTPHLSLRCESFVDALVAVRTATHSPPCFTSLLALFRLLQENAMTQAIRRVLAAYGRAVPRTDGCNT